MIRKIGALKLLAACIALLVLYIAATRTVTAEPPSPPAKIIIAIDGKQIDAIPGSTITIGVPSPDGVCTIPPYTVIIEGNTPQYNAVILGMTQDCQLIVENVSVSLPADLTAPAPPVDGAIQPPIPDPNPTPLAPDAEPAS